MKIIYYIGLFLVGTIIGSFVCCQAWRVRYQEEKKGDLGKRSVCLHCGYQLRWFDNLPIFSWLFLRGRCRKCRKEIGKAEILAEVFLGLGFLGLGLTSEINFVFFLNLILFSVLGFLAIYDGKFGELPNRQLFFAVFLGALIAILKNPLDDFFSVLAGVGILAGVYYFLFILSKEKLVGGGDWILGLALALALSDWWLALWTLFLANMFGTIFNLPLAIKKKQKTVYFGPYLVVGFFIVTIFATELGKMILI